MLHAAVAFRLAHRRRTVTHLPRMFFFFFVFILFTIYREIVASRSISFCLFFLFFSVPQIWDSRLSKIKCLVIFVVKDTQISSLKLDWPNQSCRFDSRWCFHAAVIVVFVVVVVVVDVASGFWKHLGFMQFLSFPPGLPRALCQLNRAWSINHYNPILILVLIDIISSLIPCCHHLV